MDVYNNLLDLMVLNINLQKLNIQIQKIEDPDILQNLEFDKFDRLNKYINELTEKLKFLNLTEDFAKCSLHLTKDAKRRRTKQIF